jgi:hypothetical protein
MRAPRPRTIWLLLALSVAFVWVVVGIPTWHIQPFTPQSDAGMAWSYALRRRGPLLSGAGVAVAAVLVAVGWHATARVGARLGLLALLGLALAPAWFARQNHFEWMFAPLGEVVYVAAPEATFLTEAEMVMGVQIGANAVAFPVRQLAYHHVVNTEVADEPVVATY